MIVTRAGECCFVYWNNALARDGRRVRLDQSNGVIAFVWSATVKECFKDAQVVIARTVHYSHVHSPLARSSMPSWCVLLRFYHEAQHFLGSFRAADLFDGRKDCAVCMHADPAGVHQRECVADKDSYYVCRGCLTSWHYECALTKCVSMFATGGHEIPKKFVFSYKR